MRLYDIFSKNEEYAKRLNSYKSFNLFSGITEFDDISFSLMPGELSIITSFDTPQISSYTYKPALSDKAFVHTSTASESSFAFDVALYNASRLHVPTALFSSKVTLDKMAKQLWLSLAPSEAIDKNTPLYIEATGRATISRLQKKIAALKKSSLIELVVLDSFDYIYTDASDKNDKITALYEFVRDMKSFAKQQEVFLLLTSSFMNRKQFPKTEYAIMESLVDYLIEIQMAEKSEGHDRRRVIVNKNGNKMADLLVRFNEQTSSFHYFYPEWLEAKWTKLDKMRNEKRRK